MKGPLITDVMLKAYKVRRKRAVQHEVKCFVQVQEAALQKDHYQSINNEIRVMLVTPTALGERSSYM